MSLHKYFKQTLPTDQETGLGESSNKRANEIMQNVLESGEKMAKKPTKEQTVYSSENEASIGKMQK